MISDGTKNNVGEETVHKGAGHRKRLREKFLQGGLDGFLDYEIVELLLTLGTPIKDCKQMAKDAIKEFGGLQSALDASIEDLQKIKGIGSVNTFGLKLFQAVSERLAKEKIPKKIDFNSDEAIINYLKESIGRKQKEHFVAFYIDPQNQLIESRVISIGILNASLVHPREVFEPAVVLRAASIIVAHNHPSGRVEPSSDDREVTKRLIDTGRVLGIEVRDHLVVSRSDHFSFKQELLI